MSKRTKMYKYTGVLYYRYNMFDEHDKAVPFEILWGSPLTNKDLKLKVVETYSNVLGLSQKIGDMITESVEVIIMEEK